jgi:hypothetical protein
MEIRKSHADRKATWFDIAVAWALVVALFAGLIISQIRISDPLYRWTVDHPSDRFSQGN